ncbi:mastermind-like protein 1 [Castor canadensis]|uniref:Mastermind-like protein 1 n=2 Tax=Castor canadensis TaxID=51338 RepID=A0A8B7ULK3_CASCN
MVLPTCPMAEFALPRHSAVMERLRRRIELCRRHHSTCEARYEAVSPERLELERQHTFALHQRCIQAKAKRAGKHRQPSAAAPAPAPAAPAPAPRLDAADGPEHGRPVAHLHDTVKRNLDSTASPQNGDQQNGYGDLFPGHKKTRREAPLGVAVSANGLPPASPLGQPDKPPGGDALQSSGKHSLGLDSINKKCLADSSLHLNGGSNPSESFPLSLNKELKQEPVDDLPCMITGTGGSISQSNLMPDLNLNEQEWKELIEELNRSVPDEDMKDLFTEDFEEKKEPEPSGSATQTPLTQDINIKTEFSPAAFEQEQLGSPQVRAGSAGQTFLGPSSAPVSTDSSSLGGSQTLFHTSGQPGADNPSSNLMLASAQAQNAQRALPSVVLPSQGPGGASELSSAHQLQQIAAKQKREQMLQNPQQAVAPAPGQMATWQQTGPSHSPLDVPYPMEKPASPPGYKQDFPNSKLIMMSGVTKSSPRPGGPYLQPSHVNLLSHQSPSNLNQSSVNNQGSVLDYGNTKPLSHYKADCGQAGPGSGQTKSALMAYLPQQLPHLNNEQNSLFLMKPKPGNMPFRSLVPPGQEQNPSSVPVPAQATSVGTQPPSVSVASTHTSSPYLSSQQQVAVMKQHQLLLDQQKQREQQQKHLQQQQQQFLQRQQHLLAEQEKQQFQRHLTRPPPQYQDPTQSTFPQQVGQFTGSSAAVPGMNNLGPSNSSCPRVFPQPGNLMPMGPGHTSVSSLPTNSGQQDRGVAQFTGSQSMPQSSLYGMASGITQIVAQPPPQATNGHAHISRQTSVGQNTSVPAAYGQNSLGSSGLSQQHNKGTLTSGLTKPQVPRMSAAMGGQNASWQHQGMANLSSQTPGNSNVSPFTAASSFHMQQAHLKMSSPQFSQAMSSRPMAPMSSAAAAGSMLPPVSTHQRTSAPAPAPPQAGPQQGLPGLSPAGPDLGSFSQSPTSQISGRTGLHCAQAYPVRTSGQELPFAYSGQPSSSGLSSVAGHADLIDSLLKNRTSEEWMNDLDDLLGSQ